MRYRVTFACAALAVLMASPSLAQDTERYQLERTDDGYVRLDTATGRMTLCRETDGQLVCAPAQEESAAGDLHERIEALERRIAALEADRPSANIPSEEEFEQTLGYMERFFRLFMGLVRDFDRETDDRRPEPAPDRT